MTEPTPAHRPGDGMVILVNENAGHLTTGLTDHHKRALMTAIETHLPGARIIRAAATGFDVAINAAVRSTEGMVVAGGGDGTISRVAAAIRESGKTLGVLPLGTFNFIARSVGMPLDPPAAVAAMAGARVGAVDAGEVNGRPFLHNVSLGIHPVAVELRDLYRRKLGISKAAAVAYGLLKAILRPPRLAGTIRTGDRETLMTQAPFVFVGNNRFETAPFAFIRKRSLTDGQLTVFHAHKIRPSELLAMAAKTLVRRRVREVRDLTCVVTPTVVIRSRKRRLKVVVDGEIVRMTAPLRFRNCPGCFRMLLPADSS